MGKVNSKTQSEAKLNDGTMKTVVGSKEEMVPWENLGFNFFKEIMGEELFEEKIAEADKPPPNPGPFSSLQMAWYVKKYQVSFALKTWSSRLRGTHPRGIGATGSLTVITNPLLPEHDFFKTGRVFPVRLRHSNLIRSDDAQLDVRAVSLKFADSDFDSPFDLMMHTGEEASFWNIASFDKMITALPDTEAFKQFCLEDPWHFHVTIAAFRRAPDSFADQHYYSWMAFEYKARDGVPRYAKFRLIPPDERKETGKMTEYDQRQPWEVSRWQEEERPKSYLMPEFKKRMSEEVIRYKFQIQLHEVKPDDSHLVVHPARTWDQANHPWLDLADVTLTTLLPCDVVEDTRYSLKHIPPSLAIPPCDSVYSYHSIPYLRKEVYPISRAMSLNKGSQKFCEDKVTYSIWVESGKRKGAGTDAKVSLTITGTKGRTSPLVLDKWFHDDFEAGQKDTYVMDAEDVGQPMIIRLENDRGGLFLQTSDWFVDKVCISKSDDQQIYEFPCFRWVQKESVFFEGRAKLITDNQNEAVKVQRQLELQQRQEIYQWGDDPIFNDLPGFIKCESTKTLPKDVQFTHEPIDDLKDTTNKVLLNLGLSKLLNVFDSWEDFDDYAKAFVDFVGDIPVAREQWRDDRFCGGQFLNGCNPDVIKRCTELPPNFPVTQEIVGNLLEKRDTLRKAIKDGRVYMVDYKMLEDIAHYGQQEELERRHTCASMGLFYVRSTGDMVPIAIQLHQVPSETNPIWTPNDCEMDWIFAKMWLRNADTQWHLIITRLLRCHLFMEPVAVASCRQLPSLHPVWKLLAPHIRGILAINTLGRTHLIPAGGVADNTLSLGGGGTHLRVHGASNLIGLSPFYTKYPFSYQQRP